MTRAVERALAIFDAFAADRQSLTLQEIGEQIGMPKATTFRLVNTLQRSGFLVRLEDQRYSMSLKIVRLAGLVRSTISVRDIARPIMVEVSRKIGETVTLNTRLGFERIYIDVVETPASLMTIVKPGEHVSLLFGATAKLLLAYMPEEEIDSVIKATAPPGMDVTALMSDLAAYRRDGFAHTSNQRVAGVTAIAVPLLDGAEEVHYSLAITGPGVRMDERVPMMIDVLTDAGAQISALMGSLRAPSARPGKPHRRSETVSPTVQPGRSARAPDPKLLA